MQGITLRETIHGNPGELRVLPAGLRVELRQTCNIPTGNPIKYWASPLPGYKWPKETKQWAEDVGVGLQADDVAIIRNPTQNQNLIGRLVKDRNGRVGVIIADDRYGGVFRGHCNVWFGEVDEHNNVYAEQRLSTSLELLDEVAVKVQK